MPRAWRRNLTRALSRAKWSIAAVALTYAISIATGIAAVHAGADLALEHRRRLVGQAAQHDPAALAYAAGGRWRAAAWDFVRNATLGTLPKTVSGVAVLPAFGFVAFQGWVGGIVSVRHDGSTRLWPWRSAVYYLLTLLLQVAGYSLAVGAGVNTGIALIRPAPWYAGETLLGLFPREALRDGARLYLLALPLLLAGSTWEFLSTWNR